ncbi:MULTISPECIES: hypothetical protein [unclassified Sphingomonas]|uniref:hypothetical protein n=1 Tax=unclassified Sphingomonas TaxID=196159 RepID=UPI002151E169|nr:MULTISPECIES: hypothetical protein [unclassified Sphingomonas]MCR5872440.1 hypothetical protein [Sphingomonas sp. J344]UUX99279.1 hypothetical protein LRS08_17710 [Sphingomonas sp. J315]
MELFAPFYLALGSGFLAFKLLRTNERTVRLGIGEGEESYPWLWWAGVVGGTAGFLVFAAFGMLLVAEKV